jgi:multidrug efflux pump subunit AcrB
VEEILRDTPGVKTYTSVIGFSLLSTVTNTYSAFFFVNFKPWSERTRPEERYDAIKAHLNRELGKIPEGRAIAFAPPSIPGIGTAGGFNFILEDRAGRDVAFLTENVNKFMAEAAKRKELRGISTSYLPSVPQVYVKVDRAKVLKQGIELADVYRTLQCYMGGIFVNYFNRFGRQWQVYVEAEGEYRNRADKLGNYFVRNRAHERGEPPRARVHDALQSLPERADQRLGGARVQLQRGDGGARGRFREDDAEGDGVRLHRHVLPGEEGPGGRPAGRHLRPLAGVRVPDPGGPV